MSKSRNTCMKTFFSFVLSSLLTHGVISAQNISGNLTQLTNQEIRLEGFNGVNTYSINSTITNDKGEFVLSYSTKDLGVGYLTSTGNEQMLVILSGEDIEILGEALGYTETLHIVKGQENQWFEQYAKDYPRRERVLRAWDYLEKMYAFDSLFVSQKSLIKAIEQEKYRIINEDEYYLETLPSNSYIKWFLSTRKLVSSVSNVAQYRQDEIPEIIYALRQLDYSDQRLYKSGLLKDAIESHFWLLANSGKSLDDVFNEMKLSIDAMLARLVNNDLIFNEVNEYLFDLLERHSFFEASEYLALKVLNEGRCTINIDLTNKLETYRAMKKGNIAPDIIFDKAKFSDSKNTFKKLSEIESRFTLIIFGASWCRKCCEEIPEIVNLYPNWKSKGVEVIFIALEKDKKTFNGFAKDFPFASYCVNNVWESKVVKDYFVFSTPTMYLLDDKREIILRPSSVKQMNSWVDWYIAD